MLNSNSNYDPIIRRDLTSEITPVMPPQNQLNAAMRAESEQSRMNSNFVPIPMVKADTGDPDQLRFYTPELARHKLMSAYPGANSSNYISYDPSPALYRPGETNFATRSNYTAFGHTYLSTGSPFAKVEVLPDPYAAPGKQPPVIVHYPLDGVLYGDVTPGSVRGLILPDKW